MSKDGAIKRYDPAFMRDFFGEAFKLAKEAEKREAKAAEEAANQARRKRAESARKLGLTLLTNVVYPTVVMAIILGGCYATCYSFAWVASQLLRIKRLEEDSEQWKHVMGERWVSAGPAGPPGVCFTGPQGPQGPPGLEGPPGIVGTDGTWEAFRKASRFLPEEGDDK